MRLSSLALIVLLAACAAPEPVVEPERWRDAAQPIGSTTRGGPLDLNGDWVVAAAYPGGPAVPGGTVALRLDAAGNGTWAFSGAPAAAAIPVAVTLGAPGRYRAQVGRGLAPEFWVIWVDDDFRTAVIGTPDGSFGWVMDRPGQASVDRARAAREILDFSGYDPAALT